MRRLPQRKLLPRKLPQRKLPQRKLPQRKLLHRMLISKRKTPQTTQKMLMKLPMLLRRPQQRTLAPMKMSQNPKRLSLCQMMNKMQA